MAYYILFLFLLEKKKKVKKTKYKNMCKKWKFWIIDMFLVEDPSTTYLILNDGFLTP